jgi:hypothetical protein
MQGSCCIHVNSYLAPQGVERLEMPGNRLTTEDAAELERDGRRELTDDMIEDVPLDNYLAMLDEGRAWPE